MKFELRGLDAGLKALGLSLLFLLSGLIFNGTTLVKGFIKKTLMIEPLMSVWLTFGSIAAMRFVHPAFVYPAMLSGILMYASFYCCQGLVMYELLFKTQKPITN